MWHKNTSNNNKHHSERHNYRSNKRQFVGNKSRNWNVEESDVIEYDDN